MPPPVVYVVVSIIGAVAVGYALKEFVYEPYLAPRFEAWAEEFLAHRRNRRGGPVPVPATRRRRRDSDTPSHPSHDNGDVPLCERDRDPGSNHLAAESFELDGLINSHVDEWRNEVLNSQERGNQGIRRRRTDRSSHDFDGFDIMSTTLDDSFPSLTHTPLASTHVISNVSSPITPSTLSLPSTPARRLRSHSQSTTTQEDANTLFVASFSPLPTTHELLREEPSGSMEQTPRRSADIVLSPASPSQVTPIAILNGGTPTRSTTSDSGPFPLPFTPTYQVAADDSPFGPLLPDTPRSSAEMYGDRPFSPLSRMMESSSASSPASRGPLSSSVSSTRTIGNSGTLRRGSTLVNEVVMNNFDNESDGEDARHTSPTEFVHAGAENGSLASIASLSERYPAPPTPPVVVSPPTSSIGIISAPSSPRSGGSEVVINVDFTEFQSSPQTQTAPMLRVPSDPSLSPQSRSAVPPTTSPALSFASFLSPLVSRVPSESEGDEFLSVADDASDWGVTPAAVASTGHTAPLPDNANNPFLVFEHVTRSGVLGENGSDGGNSEGSEESDESWGSARRR